MSSSSVYGPYRGTPFDEGARREPQDDYGRSKRDGEDVVWKRVREGLPAVVVRPCTVYGPGCTDGAGKVFSRPTRIGAIPGNGRQLLANVRVEDVAAASHHLSLREDAIGRAFNVVDDSRPSIEEALALAAEAFGAKPPRAHVPLALVAVAARVSGFAARARRTHPRSRGRCRALPVERLRDGQRPAEGERVSTGVSGLHGIDARHRPAVSRGEN